MEYEDSHGGAQDDFVFDDDNLTRVMLLELLDLRRLGLILELELELEQAQA